MLEEQERVIEDLKEWDRKTTRFWKVGVNTNECVCTRRTRRPC